VRNLELPAKDLRCRDPKLVWFFIFLLLTVDESMVTVLELICYHFVTVVPQSEGSRNHGEAVGGRSSGCTP